MEKDSYLKITPTQIETSHLTFEDALRLVTSATLHLMRSALAQAPNDQELKDNIYDAANQAFANILDRFDPTSTPNPDFDPSEEIEKENKAIELQLNLLRENNPRLYRRRKKEFEALKSEQRARVIQQDYQRLSLLKPDHHNHNR